MPSSLFCYNTLISLVELDGLKIYTISKIYLYFQHTTEKKSKSSEIVSGIMNIVATELSFPSSSHSQFKSTN